MSRHHLPGFFTFLLLSSVNAQERVLETISYSGAELPIFKTLYISEPGYLVAEGDSIARANILDVNFTDSVSMRTEANQARIDFPGNVALKIQQHYGYAATGSGTITIRFYPMGDVLEPNDKPEQGAQVNLNTWYQLNLFPASDKDHFRVKVEKAGWLSPEMREEPQSFYWQLLDENGNQVGSVFPFHAKPGNYIVAASRYSGQTNPDPLHFKINLLPEADQFEPNDSSAALIEMNKYYVVNFSTAQDIDRFKVKTKGKDFVSIRSYQANSSAVSFSATINEKVYTGNPLIIPPGQKEIEISMVPAGSVYRKPFYIRVDETSRMDPTESNDSIPEAVSLTKSKGIYFSVFPITDEDWFKVSMEGPGRIILNLSDAVAQTNRIASFYQVELVDTGKQKFNFYARETDHGVIYASDYIREKSEWYIRISSNIRYADEQILALRVFGPGVPGRAPDEDSFDDIYFIGFELDTSANLLLSALSESANASLTLADSTASLEKVLNEVFADAKKRKSSRSWILYAGIGIALLAGAGIVFRKKITSRIRSKT